MKLPVKNMSGQSQGELEISFPLVEGGKGTQAVHDAVVAFQAAQRSGTACAKRRGDVNATKKKPWRQKGTGRARAGSFASPIWRGGGVVFGPRPRDFSKKVSRSTRQLALRKALTERIKAGDVLVIDDLKLDNHKTKSFLALRRSLGLDNNTLVVVADADQNLFLATRNVEDVRLVAGENFNPYLALVSDRILFTKSALEKVSQRLNKD